MLVGRPEVRIGGIALGCERRARALGIIRPHQQIEVTRDAGFAPGSCRRQEIASTLEENRLDVRPIERCYDGGELNALAPASFKVPLIARLELHGWMTGHVGVGEPARDR